MDIISSKNVINIVRKTLNLIDDRLVSHGERVSYILYKMLTYENKYTEDEILKYVTASIFHDIGAYKKEELDKMVQFETNNVWGHSIYGYLFLKNLSPLKDVADIVLYHHLDYEKLININSNYKIIASYLNLADRIDVSEINTYSYCDRNEFRYYCNAKFSTESLELFEKAEKELHILERLADKSYLDELNRLLEEAVFTIQEKELFLKMLIYSIDFRSEFTVMHTITTVSFANEIGRCFGLNEYDAMCLKYGALLHDIGKISIPIDILEAPRALTSDEMNIMKKHVEISEYVLKDFINNDILEIAVRHHEKLDGSGYFKGLTAKDLNLPQRILAVADILSALCGRRSYKTEFDKKRVIGIIENEAKKGKICSRVVKCVVGNFDYIINFVKQDTLEPLQLYSKMQQEYNELYDQFCNYSVDSRNS
jgi:HD-GYP domain-containing protein (c-di-GMP phosphodiesterase class II)